MTDEVVYFPVGNGDMTLIKLRDGRNVLIDCYLQNEESDTRPAVVSDLLDELDEDENGRPYVDIFLLTHPDDDHCKGAEEFLHLAKLDDYDNDAEDKKIVIREMWSSPLVFRRRSNTHLLSDDARAINREAKRRVKAFREGSAVDTERMPDCDRVRLIGSDWRKDDGSNRLADLDGIMTEVGGSIVWYDDTGGPLVNVHIHGPHNPADDDSFDANEDVLSKNNSSVITRWKIFAPGGIAHNALLFGGDAEVAIWERVWKANVNFTDLLEYDILLAPHHCSWGVLSESATTDDDAEVNQNARSALNQKRHGARIISSSKPIKNDDNNPPAHRAMTEYKSWLHLDANFKCTGEHPKESAPKKMRFSFSSNGVKLETKAATTIGAVGIMSNNARAGSR
jgi:hypothetical protein